MPDVLDKDDQNTHERSGGFHSKAHTDQNASGGGFDAPDHDRVGISPHESAQFDQMAAASDAGEAAPEHEYGPAAAAADSPEHPSFSSDREPSHSSMHPELDGSQYGKRLADRHKVSSHHNQPSAEQKEAAIRAYAAKKAEPLAKGASKIGTPVGTASYVMKHRKQLGAGGILLVLIIAVAVGLGLLAPLKLETMIKDFMERRVTTRIEHYMDRRGERMALRYLLSSVGQNDAQFEKTIVTYGQPLRDMYRTWRVNKFEARLEANQGIKFERINGGIRVYKNGELLGDLGNKNAKIAINTAVDKETRRYNIIKRHHLRQWMRNAYRVVSWKPYDGTKGDDEAKKEVRVSEIELQAPTVAEQETGILECISGGQCLTDEGNPDEVNRNGNIPDEAKNTSADGQVSDATTSASDQATQEAKDAASKAKSTLTDRLIVTLFGKQLGPKIAAMIAESSGPLLILGLVDFASRIDHVLYPGTLDKTIVQYHKIQYAAAATRWASRSDQIKEAGVGTGSAPGVIGGAPFTSDEFNASMEFINHTENSASMQNILNGTHGGQSLYTSNDSTTTDDQTSSRSIDEHATPIADWYRKFIGDTPIGNPVPLFGCKPAPITVHCNLAWWFDTGGKIMDFINSIIGVILNPITNLLSKFPPIKWLLDHIGDILTKLILLIAGPAMTGTEIGADLANGLDAGFAVIGIDFARDLGGSILTLADANHLDATIAAEQAQSDKKVSLWDRLFSTDYSHSFINNLAIAAPVNLQGAVTDGTNYVASIATTPLNTFAQVFGLLGVGKAGADTLSEGQFNLIDRGFTEAQLEQPIDDAKLDEAQKNADTRLGKPAGQHAKVDELTFEDCPKVADPDKEVNMCRLEIATMQSQTARFTHDDDGGLNSTGGQ